MENHARTERISQESDAREDSLRDLLDRASDVARTTLESMQALAGTTSCKGVQIASLEKWSHKEDCWINDPDTLGVYSDRGSENEVYVSRDMQYIYKLNDLRYSDDNLSPFFERLKAHNHYFVDCRYELVGMSRNKDGKTCVVLRQPYIEADREATEREIHDELERLGFHAEYDGECFSNGDHDIYDALPNNVLHGLDDNLYFIDTIIYKSSADNINTYKKQSPRFGSTRFSVGSA